MNARFNDLFFAFTAHMKVKRYAAATMDAYGRELRKFLAYLEGSGVTDIKRVTRGMLNTYAVGLMEAKAQGTITLWTVSLKIRTVKRFFKYLEASNVVLINSAEYLKEPKKETRLPRTVLTEAEAMKILDMPNLSALTGIRDRTIMEVFYSTGIRLGELINLTIFDCDLQGGMLRVNEGKCAKDRVVPMGRHAVRFLKEYITRVRPHHTRNDKSTRILFVNQSGGQLSGQVVAIIVRGYAQKAGINKKVSPHVFRHTFATQLNRNGADIRAVQKMMGHSRLSVTQIYTRVAGVEVKKTHSTSHPRESDRTDRGDVTPDIRMVRGHYDGSPA